MMSGTSTRQTTPGSHLFSFGIVTDTHVNQSEDQSNSPFESGRLANRRMRHVIREFNARDLAFVVHVGDIVHPVPAIPGLYAEAAARFHEEFGELAHPGYLTPGNHDVGDKPNDWAPAARVDENHLALWKRHFGALFQSFDHSDCHFVILNAQVINSGMAEEAHQRAWLEADLEENDGRRIFLFSHYPPCLKDEDEDENYDNIGEPGRSWLLDLMERHRVEALFTGHVHNFWFLRLGTTDCYVLPSTAFVRFDYSEMLRGIPGAETEFGRNDRPKLGYAVCHVHEAGHLIEIVRTWGETAESGSVPPAARQERLVAIHPRQNRHADFGFDMRHNWMEIVEIPPTGGLDEFDRKAVRNDYPLLALWEMAVRQVRVPMRDLMVEENVARMRTLKTHGHGFTLMSFGVPTTHQLARLKANRDVFRAWDNAVNRDVLERDIAAIAEAAREAGLPLFLSRLRSIDEQRAEAGKYYHSINQGFLAGDRNEVREIARRPELDGLLAGFVFRLALEMPVWETIASASALAAELGLDARIHMRMAGNNPAKPVMDDALTVSRIAEAMAAAAAFHNVTVFADTLVDIDRGYFPRSGVLDRLCNPRPGLHVVRHMHAALSLIEDDVLPVDVTQLPDGRLIHLKECDNPAVLVLPKDRTSSLAVPWNGSPSIRINLLTGSVNPLAAATEHSITVEQSGAIGAPYLIMADREGRLRG